MIRHIGTALAALLVCAPNGAGQAIIDTVAGGGPDGVPAVSANLNLPVEIALDGAGNYYVAVRDHHRVYKVDPSGSLTVVAGTGLLGFSGDGGPARSASLHTTTSVAVDALGNVFIADHDNRRIRKVDTTGTITTVAGTGGSGSSGDGGPATAAQLTPRSLALAGSSLFVSDQIHHRVRRIDLGTGVITAVAGTGAAGSSGDGGAATSALLNDPSGLAIGAAGNLYIADRDNNRIRKVDAGGTITTVVTSLNLPRGVAVDGSDNLFIADSDNDRIRRRDANTLIVTTVAGTGTAGFLGDGGLATAARLNTPTGVTVDSAGNLLIADFNNRRVRRVDAATGIINTVAGNGTLTFSGEGVLATRASLNSPAGVTTDGSGNLYIVDFSHHRIRRVDTAGIITTVAGTGTAGFSGNGGPATSAALNSPREVVVDAAGNLFIADANNNRVRKVDTAGIITTVAGTGAAGSAGDNGPATSALLRTPTGLALDGAGNLFIADANNSRIRKVDTNGIITTVAGTGSAGFLGDGGPATSARLNVPRDVALDGAGNLLIADTNNHSVRMVNANGIITTVAGTGVGGFLADSSMPATSSHLDLPTGVAVDLSGDLLIADNENHRIRKVTAGTMTTVVGSGVFGFAGDGGPATSSRLAFPVNVAAGPSGALFIADRDNHRIRSVRGQACAPDSGPEVCDGVDNDCDGLNDEGLGPAVCGVGACWQSPTVGGPVILGGDDLPEHGSVTLGTPNTLNDGWFYIRAALENINARVVRPNDGTVAILGAVDRTIQCCNAGAAYHYAAPQAGLTPLFFEGPTAINQFFADLAVCARRPAIIVASGDGTNNDLDSDEGAALTANAARIADFVNQGGGLLSHGSGPVAYGWLNALLPGIVETLACEYTTLSLTPEGIAAFPGLTDSQIRSGPCHSNFSGDLGGLEVLARDGINRSIIIGGSTAQLPGSIVLTPLAATNVIGEADCHTVTATVKDGDGSPAAGVTVSFAVTTGPNAGRAGTGITDAQGQASFTYCNNGTPGADDIVGSFVDGSGLTQGLATAQKSWEPSPNQPPVARCAPAQLCAGAETCSTNASIDAGSSDPDGDQITTSQTPAGAYPIGTTAVTLTVHDGQASSSCSAAVTVDDCSNPTITCPAAQTLECEGACVTPASVQAPASDACTGISSVSCSPGSGAHCLGTTSHTCTALDGVGNIATCQTAVAVVDTRPPAISLAGDAAVTVECRGAFADPGAAATDVCSGSLAVSVSGSVDVNTVGAYVLNYSATDPSSNTAAATRTIDVRDTTRPTLTVPADITTECTSPDGAPVAFTATASDLCSPTVVQCGPSSGSTFPIGGPTAVNCTATDAFHNTSTGAFNVTVTSTSPTLTTNLAGSPLVAQVNTSVAFSVEFSDNAGDSHTATWDFGDGSSVESVATATSPLGTSHVYTTPGVYTVTATITDRCGKRISDSIVLVVFDPADGFTTGGGWFVPDSTSFINNIFVTDTISKANFGFIVKYRQGQSSPDGNLEFQYKAGSINLKSTAMEWMVISATKVRFKGTATINGGGQPYTFKVTAEDNGEPGTNDTFKIEIWMGAGVDTENGPPMPKHRAQGTLGGGNIQIHN